MLVSISQTALGYLVMPTQSNCIYVYIYEDSTLLLFFLSIRPGGHAISRQKPRVPFGLPYLLIESFYISMPVVRTDARAGGLVVT